MEKIEYIRCPRCELNYIDKREKLCRVCQQELATKGNHELTDEEAREQNLCPVCKRNYLIDDEEICSECMVEKSLYENVGEGLNMSEDQIEDGEDRTENWRQYVENDDAELPEDEFGDMTTIRSADDQDDILDEEDLGFDEDEEDFDEEAEEVENEDDFEDDFDDFNESLDDIDEDFEDEDDEEDEDDFDEDEDEE